MVKRDGTIRGRRIVAELSDGDRMRGTPGLPPDDAVRRVIGIALGAVLFRPEDPDR